MRNVVISDKEVDMGEMRLGDAVQGLVGRIQRDNPNTVNAARIKAAWYKTADKALSSHVTAVFMVPDSPTGEVIVYVDEPIVAADLSMQAEMLRLKLNMKMAQMDEAEQRPVCAEAVGKLRFVVSKEKYIDKSRRLSTAEELEAEDQRFKNVKPLALDDDELAQVGESVSSIEDERLRKAAFEAAKANLELSKGLRVEGLLE